MISFACSEVASSSIRLVCLFSSDFLSHSIHLMSLRFLRCFNLTEFSAASVSMMRVILSVSSICMLFTHTECTKTPKISMCTFALMPNIWIHLMNLLRNILSSSLRTEMTTSPLRICRKATALNLHESFDIFGLFEDFWILGMSGSRSMWSLISLRICGGCMLFRCSRTPWETWEVRCDYCKNMYIGMSFSFYGGIQPYGHRSFDALSLVPQYLFSTHALNMLL